MSAESSVVGGQWFTIDPSGKMSFHATKKDARLSAEGWLDSERDDANREGFWCDVDLVSNLAWGEVRQSVVCIGPDNDFSLVNVTWYKKNSEIRGFVGGLQEQKANCPWFIYDRVHEIETFNTRSEARSAVEGRLLKFMEDSNKDLSWFNAVKSLMWGRVCQVVVKVPQATPQFDEDVEEWNRHEDYCDFVFVDVLDGELKCLNDPTHDCLISGNVNALPCTDCPGDLGFFWEWRSFGGGLSRFVGNHLEEDRLTQTLIPIAIAEDLFAWWKATGAWSVC